MLAFGHNSVGALVGLAAFTYVPETVPVAVRLLIAVVVGVISHYLTDRIPHGHYEFEPSRLTTKMALLFLLDFGGSMIVLTACAFWRFGFSELFFGILVGMWAAQLPDIFEGFVNIGVIPFSNPVKKHRNFHFHTMHAKTPHHLLLPDGEARKWSYTDSWQVGCFVTALLALTLA